ncbi:MAG: glycerate kinase [Armatimonadota bacterium]
MKVVICPDSFKGSLSSAEVCDAIEKGLKNASNKITLEILKIPLADGGEGTVDALISATNGKIVKVKVRDPLMREIEAFYGILGDGKTAVIEMASASGLPLLKENERNPLITTTYGTGELIKSAIKSGVDNIIIGIGGSATNDGGSGAMRALGAEFLDNKGNTIEQGGEALQELSNIDMSQFLFPVNKIKVEVACDVTNPLCGEKGASAVYGHQKGATPEMVQILDKALYNYAEIIKKDLKKDVANLPGAGAAGGLGAGLAAFLNAELRSGIDIVLDALDFDNQIQDANVIITGEGKIDEQTAYGKTIGGMLKRVKEKNIPVIAIAGAIQGDITALYNSGLTSAFSICNSPMSLENAMANSNELLKKISENIARLILQSKGE